jgi:hypothetical protein
MIKREQSKNILDIKKKKKKNNSLSNHTFFKGNVKYMIPGSIISVFLFCIIIYSYSKYKHKLIDYDSEKNIETEYIDYDSEKNIETEYIDYDSEKNIETEYIDYDSEKNIETEYIHYDSEKNIEEGSINKEKGMENYALKEYHEQEINNSIYTIIVGGLGNQLFMIFNIISLAKKYGKQFYISFDENYQKHYKEQKGVLRKNCINYNLFKNIDFCKININENNFKNIQEKGYMYDEVIIDNSDDNYQISGYFQSYKYFWKYREEIKKYIYIDNDRINEIKRKFSSYNKKILSIHIRLGDYTNLQNYHYNAPIEYYQKALSEYNLDEYQIIIFSDDIKLANEKIKHLKINYINADDLFTDDEDQFLMLSLSDVKICCASTFSLMACYFNEIFNFVDDCDNIFPEKWFGIDGPDYNIFDLLLLKNTKFMEPDLLIPEITSKNNYIIKNLTGINYDITLVSGYWCLNKSKFNNYKYVEWFNNSLCINSPLIFFSDNISTINLVKKIRKNLPTYYVILDMNKFVTQKYKDLFIIDNRQSPSKELNMIWNEKIFLVQKSLEINPFNSNFYCWYDAGLCLFRDRKIPEIKLDSSFLNKNKISFTNPSHIKKYEQNKLKNYGYHYVTGTYIIPKNIISKITKIYESYLNKYVDDKFLWTDQIIWTHIYNDYPELFENIGEGYGYAVLKLMGY